jgi:5'-3' exonuclease
MIIIDYNGIAIGNIITQKLDINEDLIRHMILNTIRMYNKKFRDKYGQVVIACDSSSWRRDYFPNYKFKRREGREEDKSSLDWNEVFRIINQVRDEIRDNFPYKVLHIDKCEADDIIATVVETTQEFGQHEDVMIVSADKDFIQLHKYDNVRQYSPMTKKFIEDKNPRTYITEHVFKGDSSDGVPNVLSPDNTFVDGIRQSPVTKKKIETWMASIDDLRSVMDEETYRNYCRNKKLIDLSEIPDDIKQNIINIYENTKTASKLKVLNYLIKKRCKMLIESVEEFY